MCNPLVKHVFKQWWKPIDTKKWKRTCVYESSCSSESVERKQSTYVRESRVAAGFAVGHSDPRL